MSSKPKSLLTVVSMDNLPEMSRITLKSTSNKGTQKRTLPPLSIGSSMNNVFTTISHSKNLKSEESSSSTLHLNKLKKNFKNNFYEDVTPATLTKLQKNVAFNDKYISSQVIYMNKFVHFWKCFCDYSNPIVSIAKFKTAKKALLEKDKANEAMKRLNAYKERSKQTIRPQRLYTNSSIFEREHKMRVEKEKEFFNRVKLNNMYLK